MSIELLPGSGASLRAAADAILSTVSALDAAGDVGARLETMITGDVWRGPARAAFEPRVMAVPVSAATTAAQDALTGVAMALGDLAAEHDRHQDELRYLLFRWESLVAAGMAEEVQGELLSLEQRADEIHRVQRMAEDRLSVALVGGAAVLPGAEHAPIQFFRSDGHCTGAQFEGSGGKCYLPAIPPNNPGQSTFTEVFSEDPGPVSSGSGAEVNPADPTTITPRIGPKTDFSDVALWAIVSSQLGQLLGKLVKATRDGLNGRSPLVPPYLNVPLDQCRLDPWSCEGGDEPIAAGP